MVWNMLVRYSDGKRCHSYLLTEKLSPSSGSVAASANGGGERAGELNSREPTMRALTLETAKKNDELFMEDEQVSATRLRE